jgi:hypothetical protein
MDVHDHEQTALLREIWQQMVALNKGLTTRIDLTNAGLDRVRAELATKIDLTNTRLERVTDVMVENFGRVQRKFDRVDQQLGSIDQLLGRRDERMADLDSRLSRVEHHVGLRDD